MVGVAGTLELFGGALVLIGLFTRPVAFILSGLMAFAYFNCICTQSFLAPVNGGELAIVYSFIFLYLVFADGCDWSIDKLRLGKGM